MKPVDWLMTFAAVTGSLGGVGVILFEIANGLGWL